MQEGKLRLSNTEYYRLFTEDIFLIISVPLLSACAWANLFMAVEVCSRACVFVNIKKNF